MAPSLQYNRLPVIFFLFCLPFHAAQAVPVSEKLQINLSNEVQMAINNGVKLVFDCDYAKHQLIWLISRHKQYRHHQFELQRHSLSNSYVVRRDSLETQRIFRSIPEATTYISTQAALLFEFYHGQEKSISVRVSLNKYALPGPMRLGAYLTQAWDLDSGWVPE